MKAKEKDDAWRADMTEALMRKLGFRLAKMFGGGWYWVSIADKTTFVPKAHFMPWKYRDDLQFVFEALAKRPDEFDRCIERLAPDSGFDTQAAPADHSIEVKLLTASCKRWMKAIHDELVGV